MIYRGSSTKYTWKTDLEYNARYKYAYLSLLFFFLFLPSSLSLLPCFPYILFCALSVNLSGHDNCNNLISLTTGLEYKSEPQKGWGTGRNQLLL